MFTRILVWLGIALFSTVQLPARSITERDRNHWAFQPIRRVEPPVARTASTSRANWPTKSGLGGDTGHSECMAEDECEKVFHGDRLHGVGPTCRAGRAMQYRSPA